MPDSAFIVLDGLDGTGKSTQCRLIAERLRAAGHEVVTCVDPGGTAIGAQLREILLHHSGDMARACEALLFMASRAQLVHEIIRPALTARKIVVSDRYVLANIVYQGYGAGLDVAQLWDVGRLSTGGLEPDLTLVLDLDVDEAARRRGRTADRMESRGREFQERVRAGFRTESERQPDKVRRIDASPAIEVVNEAIWREVSDVLAARSRS